MHDSLLQFTVTRASTLTAFHGSFVCMASVQGFPYLPVQTAVSTERKIADPREAPSSSTLPSKHRNQTEGTKEMQQGTYQPESKELSAWCAMLSHSNCRLQALCPNRCQVAPPLSP
eukprot:SAG31_NODE_8977_length_1354_cov_1.075697_3_plen_116_part_00